MRTATGQTGTVLPLAVGIEQHLDTLRVACLILRELYARVREAVGEPYEGDATREDTHTATHNQLVAGQYVPAETDTRTQKRILRQAAVGLYVPSALAGIAVELYVGGRRIEEQRHLDTCTVGQLQVVRHVPLVLQVEAQLSGSELSSPARVARHFDVSLVEIVGGYLRAIRRACLEAVVIAVEVVGTVEIVASVEVLDEEVAELIELVVRTERDGMVACQQGQVVLEGVDVLIQGVGHRAVLITDIDGRRRARVGRRHVAHRHTREGSTRCTLIAHTDIRGTQLVAQRLRQLAVQLGHKGVCLRCKLVGMVVGVSGQSATDAQQLLGVNNAPTGCQLVGLVNVPVELDAALVVLDVFVRGGIDAVILKTLSCSHLLHLIQNVVGYVGINQGALRAHTILAGVLLLRLLVVGKEEELVLHDRTAQRDAVAIFLLFVVRLCIRSVEVLVVTADEILVHAMSIDAAVESVRTTLRDGVDGTTREATLTHIVGSDVDVYLLDRLHRHRLCTGLSAVRTIAGQAEDVVVHGTVNLERVVAVALSGKRHGSRLLVARYVGVQAGNVGDALRHRRHVVDHVGADALRCTHLRSVKTAASRHHHLLQQLRAFLHTAREVFRLTQSEVDIVEHGRLVGDIADFHRVRPTDAHTLDSVSSVGVGYGAIDSTRWLMLRCDGSPDDGFFLEGHLTRNA